MPSPRLRLAALALLALWVAPGASALAVGLHVALEHHHGPDPHGGSLAVELALATVHGHRHDLEAVPDHEHPAPGARGPCLRSGAPPVAVLPPSAPGRLRLAAADEILTPARRGPPAPLFSTHCSLLL